VPVHLYKEIYRLLDTLEQPADVILCPLRVVLPETDRVVDSSRTLNWLQNVEAPEIVVDIRPETGHVLPLDMTAEAEAEQIHIWFSHLEAHP
jgi:esterase/lipase